MKRKNPFANPDHPLGYVDGKLIYARDVPDLPEKPRTEPDAPHADSVPPITSPVVGSALYKGLQWEQPAYREPNQTEKKLLTYNESLDRLQAAGFERHPRPAEVFALLADNLEGKLSAAEKSIADDMLISYGEWLSLAIERKGDILVAYFDPVGLQWNTNTNTYDVQGTLQYSERKEFSVAGKQSGVWIDLNQFSADFVRYFYSRPFDALPQEMKQGGRRAQIALPAAGQMWPVGRSFSWFVIYVFGVVGASRGVRSSGKKNLHRK